MTPWYIDAIDVRGGLAVATQRMSDLKLDGLTQAGPSAFISPPAFVPEFVERSTGFALSRARGQAGLFHGENEVPFDTLAALAEFVRRSFLRGAGGDGTGENGGSTPPPPPSPDGDKEAGRLQLLEGGEEFSDLAMDLLNLARGNSRRSENLEMVRGQSARGEALAPPDSKGKDLRPKRLARGALRVLRELVRRRPNQQPDNLHWSMALEKLIHGFMLMGLFPLLHKEFENGKGAAWIFGGGYQPVTDLDHDIYRYFNQPDRRDFWYWRDFMLGSMTDAFDDLAVFPVPPHTVQFAPKDGQNLQAILSAAIATPNQMLSENKKLEEEERAELVIFAAAYINLGGERFISRRPYNYYVEFCDHLVVKAQTWLGSNVPKYVYATDVENLIAGASSVPA
jgi:hypothetical protein